MLRRALTGRIWRVAAVVGWGVAAAEEPPPVDVAPAPPSTAGNTTFGLSVAPGELGEWSHRRASWIDVGPPELVGARAILAHDGLLYVLDGRGAVWRGAASGGRWEVVLDGLLGQLGEASAAEDALLDIETRMQELMDGVNPYDTEAVDEAMSAAADEVQADLRGDAAFREATGERPTDPRRTWGGLGVARGALYALRSDGAMRSIDGGKTWRGVVEGATRAVLERANGQVLIAGDGVIWRSRGERFVESEVVPSSAAVWALVEVDGVAIAATDDGLWSSEDGERWAEHGVGLGAVMTMVLLAAEGTEGPVLLVSDGESVLRSDDAGLTFQALPGSPPGVRALFPIGGRRVLAAGDGGAWLGRNLLRSWEPLAGGARLLAGRAITLADGTPVLAADEGVVRVGTAKEAGDVHVRPWVPLETLQAAASRRAGLGTTGDRLGSAGSVLLWLLPQVRVQVRSETQRDIGSGLDAGIQTSRQRAFESWLQLTWMPPRRNLSAADWSVYQRDDGDFNVYESDTDQWMMLGRVGRDGLRHKTEIAAEIGALYQRRAGLVQDLSLGRVTSLGEQVNVTLRIAEIEARLDLLTDGAVRRFPTAAGGAP